MTRITLMVHLHRRNPTSSAALFAQFAAKTLRIQLFRHKQAVWIFHIICEWTTFDESETRIKMMCRREGAHGAGLQTDSSIIAPSRFLQYVFKQPRSYSLSSM